MILQYVPTHLSYFASSGLTAVVYYFTGTVLVCFFLGIIEALRPLKRSSPVSLPYHLS